jgi:transposase-like protein
MIRCPVCNSRDIYVLVGGYIGQVYRCKSCGYRGSLVVECALDDRETGKRDGDRQGSDQ